MAKERILFKAVCPSAITPEITSFCAELDHQRRPEFLTVTPHPDAMLGVCYANVEMMIRQSFGEKQMGWMIWQYKNWYLCAEHHCVWRSPSGSLMDVTPQFDNTRRLLFLPSDIEHPSYFGGTPASRYRLLTDHPELRDYLKHQLKSVEFKSNPVLNRGNPVNLHEHEATKALMRYQRFLDMKQERKRLEKVRENRRKKSR